MDKEIFTLTLQDINGENYTHKKNDKIKLNTRQINILINFDWLGINGIGRILINLEKSYLSLQKIHVRINFKWERKTDNGREWMRERDAS